MGSVGSFLGGGVIRESKCSIFGFWTVVQTKQDIRTQEFGLCVIIFSIFSTIKFSCLTLNTGFVSRSSLNNK